MDSVTLPSMTIAQLNNFVIKLRKPAKTSRVQVVQKLIRKLKDLESKKKEDTKSKNKIERTLKEIEILQKTNINILITFSLANNNNLDEVSKHSSVELTAFTRFCLNKTMATVVGVWRKGHGDWQRLANYWRNHVSQRKKKKPTIGRDTLLIVEKVLLGGKKGGVGEKIILGGEKSRVVEKVEGGLASGISGKNDLIKDGDDGVDSKDAEDSDGGSDDDCDMEVSGSDKDENTENEKKNKKPKVNSNLKETKSTDNKTKTSITTDNNNITENITKSEKAITKGKRKSLATEEAQIKRISSRKIVEYDASVGIQRFLMDEMDGGGEMKVGGCNKEDDLEGKKVKNKAKISSMFEGGEDDEEEDDVGGEGEDDKAERGGFQLNKTRKGFEFKVKANKKHNSKMGKNRSWNDKGGKQKYNHKATNNHKNTKDSKTNTKASNKTNKDHKENIKTSKGSQKEDDSEMHPSWLARKKQKELQSSSFAGKKIVFDD